MDTSVFCPYAGVFNLMFNLFRSNAKVTRYMMGGFLLVVAASMLTYLTQTGLTSADSETVVAQVGPSKITAAEVQAAVQRGLQGGQLSPNTVDLMLPTFVDQMLQQRAAIYAFNELGLKVSDEEVLTGMMSIYPQFFQNGKLTQRDQLEQQLDSERPDAVRFCRWHARAVDDAQAAKRDFRHCGGHAAGSGRLHREEACEGIHRLRSVSSREVPRGCESVARTNPQILRRQ